MNSKRIFWMKRNPQYLKFWTQASDIVNTKIFSEINEINLFYQNKEININFHSNNFASRTKQGYYSKQGSKLTLNFFSFFKKILFEVTYAFRTISVLEFLLNEMA